MDNVLQNQELRLSAFGEFLRLELGSLEQVKDGDRLGPKSYPEK